MSDKVLDTGKDKAAEAADATEGRRQFLVSAITVGWLSFTGAIMATFIGIVRFIFPNVLFEPPQVFFAGKPNDYAEGMVSIRWKNEHGVWIVHDGQQLYAIMAYCTHLGCTTTWQENEHKFKCPCHGSGFKISGLNFEGPAPRPLERCAIELNTEGLLIVDKSKRFLHEKGQWDDSASFVKV